MAGFQVQTVPTTTHLPLLVQRTGDLRQPAPVGRSDRGDDRMQRAPGDSRRGTMDQGNPLPTDVTPRSPAEIQRLQRDLNFGVDPGRHTVDSPVVGSRIGEMDTLRAAADANPRIVDFANALYDGNIYMIPRAMQADADRLAYANFAQYVGRYSDAGVTPQNAVHWVNGDFTRTVIYDTENANNTWRVDAMVGDAKTQGDAYLPRGIAARHELMHVEETRPRETDAVASENPVAELMPTMMTIIENDTLRKQLAGQPLDATIDYGRSVTWGDTTVPLGTLANRMRELVARHGSYGAAMAAPEALAFLAKGCAASGASVHRFSVLGNRMMAERVTGTPCRLPNADCRKPKAENRKPKAESRKPKAESRKPKTDCRKPNAENQLPRLAPLKPHRQVNQAPRPLERPVVFRSRG